MKERPILFSGEMVRAILDGRKTQTRRIVKPAVGYQSEWLSAAGINSSPSLRICRTNPDNIFGAQMDHPKGGPLGFVKCPYGEPGDRLWVRECFSYSNLGDTAIRDWVWYWADSNPTDGDWTKPKPSIHMPRWASRINLEVTNVRVERLQDIGDKDATAEGCPGWYHESYPDQGEPDGKRPTEEFAELWESINGAGSWDLNPWVWVIEFKRIDVR